MSVLITGVEIPTTCGSCWFCRAVSNEKWHCRLTGKSFASYSVGWGNVNNTGDNGQRPYIRHEDCPIIHVPPHGRLIDADGLEKECQKRLLICTDQFQRPYEVMRAIALAPTVIKPDGGE